MSYQLESVDSVLQYVNTANSTAYVKGDLTFSAPQVVNGTWREQATTHNTAVRVTGVPGKGYQGNKVILYDRLNLASLANILGWQVFATGADSVHDILDLLDIYTGVKLTTNDVEDTPFVTQDDKLIAPITAKPGSLGWIGAVNLEVKAGGLMLDASITQPTLNGLNYPTALDTDVYGSIYTYGYDFTNIFDTMIAITNGPLPSATADALVTYLKSIDISSGATLWNNTQGSTSWSLYGATVTHSGLNDPVNMPTNPAYKYVVALQLAAGVTVPAGMLYLHFNDPFNPDDF